MAEKAPIDFHFKYGFGIIPLLNCAKCPAGLHGGSAEGAGVLPANADVAQSAEHPPCKRAVIGSIPIVGFTLRGKKLIAP
jgi:hypothetical protein